MENKRCRTNRSREMVINRKEFYCGTSTNCSNDVKEIQNKDQNAQEKFIQKSETSIQPG
ncbi:6907_t:CDS:2, partial [Gigaspora margarita]